MRISNSFSEGEVQVLEFILQTLLRGGSPTMATRHKDFSSLYRKVGTMRKRLGHRVDQPQDSEDTASTADIHDLMEVESPTKQTVVDLIGRLGDDSVLRRRAV